MVNEFINSCKMKLRDGVVETSIIDGVITKCTVFEDINFEIIKSMVDYSMIVIKKDNNKKVICLDKEGHISKIDSEWRDLIDFVD
jgi:hypothetical protein